MDKKNSKTHNQKEEALQQEIENTTILNIPKEESSNKVEDTFKVEKEETKKVETPKKKVDIQKVKETLNKPIYVSKKTQEEKEEEKKKKRRFIIILLLLLLFFFFLLDVDDLIIGTPLRPRLTKVDENWYKEKVVKIEEDAYTRKNLSHYLYCIRQDDDISKCEWKETYTKNVVVSQNGENYVWFKGVTDDGLVGKPSDPIKVKIDNEAIKDIEI